MKFKELVKFYPPDKQNELALLLIEFIDIQMKLSDLNDREPKGNVVEYARTVAEVLKKPPWSLDVDFLWHICLELEEYRAMINDWLHNSSSR